jgi:hypothetical protein
MSYSIDQFETLRSRFPTWPELKAHLSSPEGGSLRVVETADSPLVVIRYTRGTEATGLFRSVVWDTEANLPVSVAPAKAAEGPPPVDTQLSATEDFVDGVMVNAFVGPAGVLQLATRTTIGAENHFYSQKSFAAMFQEGLANSSLESVDVLQGVLQEALKAQGGVSCFVSFVLQHPEHRIVVKVENAALNVVHVGYVSASGVVTMCERATNWPQAFGRLQIHSYATRRFKEGEAEQMLQRTAVQRGWRWQGLVFKDGAGKRWRLRSTTYTMLRGLRGGEATVEDRFLRLRHEKKVVEYLKHYSEERDAFWQLETVLRARTEDVLKAYTDVHKAHLVAFKDLAAAYKPAVFLLHALWRDQLRAKGFVVRNVEAIQVVGGLRDFEQKRLMAAAAYLPAAVPAAAVPAVALEEKAIDLDIAAC